MRIVSFNISHDSSVCSYNDGQIEFFCKEERVSRFKRDKCPFLSLELFHKFNEYKKIDHFLYSVPTNGDLQLFGIWAGYIAKKFRVELQNFSSLNHHLCHASLAFYNSGFDECLVFVIDRNGSLLFYNGKEIARESESVYLCKYPHSFEEIYKSFWVIDETQKELVNEVVSNLYKNSDTQVNNPYGIVKVYESATTLIGQNPLESGKTMGLSSYGEDIEYPSLFLNGSSIGNYFSQIDYENNINFARSCFYGMEKHINPYLDENNYQIYANKAKHVQIETQKEVLRVISKYVDKTGIKKVCVVGGYALNVVANNFYLNNRPDINFYFEPIADDTGVPIGSSMLKYRMETKDNKKYKLKNNFFHYYEEEKLNLGKDVTVDELVNHLIDQKIVAIFNGKPEVGPRALGHRSLLFDPRNSDGKDIMNSFKMREWYRPFAGVILEEHFDQYFETLGIKKSEYMTINFEVKTGVKEYVPSIVHVDNTCRVQTVSEDDGFLFLLLSKFYEKTKCPMLMNTSFNLAGEPLIQTKKEAIEIKYHLQSNVPYAGVYFVDEKKLIS